MEPNKPAIEPWITSYKVVRTITHIDDIPVRAQMSATINIYVEVDRSSNVSTIVKCRKTL